MYAFFGPAFTVRVILSTWPPDRSTTFLNYYSFFFSRDGSNRGESDGRARMDRRVFYRELPVSGFHEHRDARSALFDPKRFSRILSDES